MKKIARYLCMLSLAAMTLTACHDNEVGEYTFNAKVEQPTGDDGSKVFLLNERFVYWEIDDKINIFGDNGEKEAGVPVMYEARLVNASNIGGQDGEDMGFFNGVFVTTMTWGSKYFLGIYPKDAANSVSSTTQGSSDFGTVTVNIPAEQGLRTDDKGDITFNNNVFPMVAWYGGEWTDSTTAYNLDFHSVASIVRIQLFDSTGVGFTLDSIEFTSRNNATQLSGPFTVNNYKTEDPSVTATGATAKTSRVAIANKNGTSLNIAFTGTTLRTFYLVLPAYQGRHASTTFELTMTVHADGGTKTFSQNFSVTTRRNGITYMRAVGIKDWSLGTTTAGSLVGNGTADRPFKVYTKSDLIYLRNCYNSVDRLINNQPITAATEIRIMRSDIALRPADWATGINNFIGHISYTTTGATGTTQGILNNSGHPIFNSIGTGGVVEGLTVNMDTNLVLNGSHFSPFCTTNNGEIRNCRIMSRKGSTQGVINIQSSAGGSYGLAGICVENTNLITGSGCIAQFNSQNRNVTGICLLNNGTIEGCYIAAPMTIKGAATASGICYNNSSSGTVKDCYFSTITDSVGCNWGGIVYTNRGVVKHCYTRETASIISSGSVGGIVNTNISGTLNYCWSEAALKGNGVGLIAATMTGGRMVNCFCNNRLTTVTLQASTDTRYGGGLVGDVNGSCAIENSFIYINKVQLINNIGTIGGLVGHVGGTTATITNCYVYEYTGGSGSAVGVYNDGHTGLFTNCYIVGGSHTGTGLTQVSTDPADLQTSLTTVYNGLHDYYTTPGGSNWVDWQRTAPNPPTLQAYSNN